LSTAGGIETEVKLRVSGNAESAIRLLEDAGFRVSVPRVFEANSVYDTETDRLRAQGELLRLRLAGDVVTLTWKGPAVLTGPHKSRPETEVRVDDFVRADQLLNNLGYRLRFRYDKYRTEFASVDPGGTATLDETPIGLFLELEGAPDWIDRMAARLGYAADAYITLSYGALYQKYRGDHPGAPSFMTFPDA
jgi:adenylate cyclase class 2